MSSSQQVPKRDPRETARYVQRLTKELRTMAADSDLAFLAYLLSMAEEEAAATARRLDEK